MDNEFYWEITPRTFGKWHLIWTDGFSVDKGY